MEFLLEVPDEEAIFATEVIRYLSPESELTPVSDGTPPPLTTEQAAVLEALRALAPGEEAALAFLKRLYDDRRDAPRDGEL